MNDWHRTLFDHYAAHYHVLDGKGRERLPEELERLKRDRLPRWIDEVPRTVRVLDWSWRKPHRSVLRLANYARWHVNRWLHRAVYLLNDFDFPRQFDPNLVVLAHK